MDLKASQKLYVQLQEQIEKAQKSNMPVGNYVKRQIKILEDVHDDFVSSVKKNDKNWETNLEFTGIRIKQLQAIASLCKKIGLPTEKYDNKIREIRVKNLGVDFVNEHYE